MFARHFFNAIVGTVMLVSVAQAHEFKSGDIQINHPFARATVVQQTSGSAYLSLENNGKTDDKLVKVESGVAKTVEIHSMNMVGDVMKMRAADDIKLAAGSKVSMKPGSEYHVMLTGLKKPLHVGDKFPMTLHFEKAGKIKVIVNVEANVKASATMHQH